MLKRKLLNNLYGIISYKFRVCLSLEEGVLLRKEGVVTTSGTCTLLFEPRPYALYEE